ncbi:GNAT family N-acetyltransferase [Streptomyces thermospinosisporus]|uniref:GNAT family N-acetyltransferase n=1 Tax=Streptomyces thermospinosisporus TaxID=161482 RepID=A0ABN1Z305_9ACTN
MSDHDDPHPAIRSAREEDLPEIHRLDNEVFTSSPYSFLVLRQHFDAHGDHLLVRYEGESLQGYVLSAVRADRLAGWVHSLAVAREQRGRGLGRQLMEEALRRLDEAGVLEARLAVEPANTPAITLYEALGFSPDGAVQQDYFGPGEERLIMSLKL